MPSQQTTLNNDSRVGSKKDIEKSNLSKIVKQSVQTRSSVYEGGDNDKPSFDHLDKISMDGQSQDSSSRRAIEYDTPDALKRQLNEQTHIN